MKILRFTDINLRSLPEGKFRDSMLPAFCIRVGKHKRTFYTVRNGRVTTIGHFPTITLQEARKAARRVLEHEGAPLASVTFREAYTAYQKRHLVNYRPNTQYQTDRLIERYCQPLMRRPLDELKSADITALTTTASQSAANHIFGVLRTFFRWCERNDLLQHSPISKLTKPFKEASRDRLLTDEEIRAIWNASTGPFGALSRCLILSGQRRGQFATFKPTYISGDTIRWPANAMKNAAEHVIPLTPALTRQLSLLAPRYLSFGKPMLALRRAAGVGDFTLHDYRRYVSSTMRMLKVPIDCTEYLLAHTAGSRSEIQRIYDRYDRLNEVRDALSLYHEHLTRIGLDL